MHPLEDCVPVPVTISTRFLATAMVTGISPISRVRPEKPTSISRILCLLFSYTRDVLSIRENILREGKDKRGLYLHSVIFYPKSWQ